MTADHKSDCPGRYSCTCGFDVSASLLREASVQITRKDAEVIHRMMAEFFHANNLSPEETAALMNLSSAGDFGRPVPKTWFDGDDN